MNPFTSTVRRSLLLAIVVAGITPAQSTLASDLEGNIRLLEAWIEAQVAYDDFPGVSIAIVHNDALLYAKGFGHSDLTADRQASPRTLYRVGSISKMITAVAVLQLRDQGLLSLDDTVISHLSWFGQDQITPEAREITIRQLLTHTAGLRFEAGPAGRAYWQNLNFPTSAEVKTAASKIDPVVPPASRWKYSNYGYVLLGEIISAVTDRSYEDYVEGSILTPLAMRNTSFSVDEATDLIATGYSRRLPGSVNRTAFDLVSAKGINAAGGLISNAEDLAKFLGWLMTTTAGKGTTDVLAPSTVREMGRVHWLDPSWASGRGLGFEVLHQSERNLVGHSGLFPGFQSAAYISPAEEMGVVVLVNSFSNPLFTQVHNIVARAFDWIAPQLANSEQTSDIPDDWTDYQGTFRHSERDYLVLSLDGQLRLLDPTTFNPKSGHAVLVPVAQDTFRIEGSGSVPIGELAVFERASGGEVSAMRIGDWGSASRVSL